MTTTPPEFPREISVEAVKQLLETNEPFLFIDCREPDEYEFCRIAGTQLLPIKQVSEWLPRFERSANERIVVHCHHGKRSTKLMEILRQAGYTRAQSMEGGIHAWSEQVDPQIPIY